VVPALVATHDLIIEAEGRCGGDDDSESTSLSLLLLLGLSKVVTPETCDTPRDHVSKSEHVKKIKKSDLFFKRPSTHQRSRESSIMVWRRSSTALGF